MDICIYSRVSNGDCKMMMQKYITGFALSLALTLVAYFLVINNETHPWMLVVLGVLAATQLAVQLLYFLHLDDEVGPRLKQLSFWFMALILLIIVVGSIWIMNNLNERMMHFSPTEKNQYMLTEYDKGF